MNRQIKFRVRNMKTKELIGYERINEQGHWEQQRIGRKEWLLGVMTDGQVGLEFIREQYTGRKDKNGIEIFEDDIVAGYSQFLKKTQYKQVAFEGNGWVLIPVIGITLGSELEVVGNIYRNKHLLQS